MKIIDITYATHGDLVTWDGSETGYTLEPVSRIDGGASCNVSLIHMGAHTGTHLDAPFHFIEGGNTVESLELSVLVGPVVVADLTGLPEIGADDLKRLELSTGVERIILKTDNTARRLLEDPKFHRDYVGVNPSGASWLVEHGIKLIGVDYLSVGKYNAQENGETHRRLLGNHVVVLEGLSLNGVEPGEYTLAALPPKLVGLDGAPIRAILLKD